jgi:thioredoxin-like negative regulator of GroEL
VRTLLIVLGLVLVLAPSVKAADPSPPAAPPKSPAKMPSTSAKMEIPTPPTPLRSSLVEWRADLPSAQKEAAASDRMVMIFFSAQWCQPCGLMDRGPFAIPVFVKYLAQNFVPVKVDDTTETSAVSKQFQIKGYPTLLFLTAAGDPIHEIVGPMPAADLYQAMKLVRAIPAILEAQKKAPDDLEANSRAADAWVAIDRLAKAEPFLRRIAELDPKNEKGKLHQARLMLAMMPMEEGDTAQALKNIDAWMAEYPESPETPAAMLFKGKIFWNEGRLAEARAVLDDLRTRFPKSSKSYEADKTIDAIDARIAAAAKRAADAEKQKSAPTSTAGPAVTPTAAPVPTPTVVDLPKG